MTRIAPQVSSRLATPPEEEGAYESRSRKKRTDQVSLDVVVAPRGARTRVSFQEDNMGDRREFGVKLSIFEHVKAVLISRSVNPPM